MLSSVDAIAKIDPRIGPMQGVQPKPNAIPTKIELNTQDFLSAWNLFS